MEIVHRNFFTMTSLAVSNMFSLSKFNILQYPKKWMSFAESEVVALKKRCAAVKMSSAEAELGLAEQLELAKYQVLLLAQVLYSSGNALMMDLG